MQLRQSLVQGERKTNNPFCNPENNTEDDGYDSGDPDVEPPDFDMPDNTFNPEDVPPYQEKVWPIYLDSPNAFGTEISRVPSQSTHTFRLCSVKIQMLMQTLKTFAGLTW